MFRLLRFCEVNDILHVRSYAFYLVANLSVRGLVLIIQTKLAEHKFLKIFVEAVTLLRSMCLLYGRLRVLLVKFDQLSIGWFLRPLYHTWYFKYGPHIFEFKRRPVTQLSALFIDLLPHQVFSPLAKHN